jgi:uncharacterized protein YecE (DUF72 family)
MHVLAGTSGFSYKEWKGSFYPEDLPAAEMLAYYAGRLDTVEINNTFYRMPKRDVVRGWAAQVRDGFQFCLKATQRITHKKKLADAEDEIAFVTDNARELGPKLGPMLFQLPPWLRKGADRLRAFFAALPADWRSAFEFRHASWFDEEIYGILREHGAALVVSEADDADAPPPLVATAPFGYLRLRRAEYGAKGLQEWAARLKDQLWEEAHVFFKHEEEGAGPALAARFRELCG